MVMDLLRSHKGKVLSQSDLTQPNSGEQVVMLRTVSLAECLVYGMRKIFSRHQVSKASRRFAGGMERV